MSKIRNKVNSVGYYQGVPVVDIVVDTEPTFEWLEELPSFLNHAHICIQGTDCLQWDLDALLTTIYQNTALSYTQLITDGSQAFLGVLRPNWLTVILGDYALAVPAKEINELVVPVDDELVWEQVETIAASIRNFELVMSFTPSEPQHQSHAMELTLKFDQFLSMYGQAKYIPLIRR